MRDERREDSVFLAKKETRYRLSSVALKVQDRFGALAARLGAFCSAKGLGRAMTTQRGQEKGVHVAGIPVH